MTAIERPLIERPLTAGPLTERPLTESPGPERSVSVRALILRPLRLVPLALAALLLPAAAVRAQSESFLLGPGSNVGPSTEVKPKNCVTDPDGTIRCDTELVNPPSNTPARPQFDPFRN